MKISPNYTATMLRDAAQGQLILCADDKNKLQPFLIVAGAADEGVKMALQLSGKFVICLTDKMPNKPVIVVDDDWQIRLAKPLAPKSANNAEEADPGKLSISTMGRFIAARVAGDPHEDTVLVDVDKLSVVEHGAAYDGKKWFEFDWILESRSGPGDSWEEIKIITYDLMEMVGK